ncbi:MAG: glycosyltransferase family 4 protein [Actinobacteria bacterium]|nr:glycosyltransferase family 4 protein [Actinomycetota bacterium]
MDAVRLDVESELRTGAELPRVLFVSHEASRTGAPMVLLHLLRWIRANTEMDFEILLLSGGPMVEEFRALAPTHQVEALGQGPFAYFEGGLGKAGFPGLGQKLKVVRARRSLSHLGDFDALYLNSATSAFALQALPKVPPVVVSHIHELDSAFAYWFPEPDRSTMLAATDWFVACADAVGRNLTDNYGIPADRVSTHYEFVDVPEVDVERAANLRAELGIPARARLVGGSGVMNWRKAPDLFVQVAAAACREAPEDVHFVWIGGPGDEPLPIEQDLAKLGLTDRVHFVGEVVDPMDLFSQLDVFCLTSREDPYPLVMLESAGIGVPIVAFPNGGVVEFAGSSDPDLRRAVIVPYLDADAMGEAVAELLGDEEQRLALAARGRHRVRTEHTIPVGASALYADLVGRIERGGRPGSEDRAGGGALVGADRVGASGVTGPTPTALLGTVR